MPALDLQMPTEAGGLGENPSTGLPSPTLTNPDMVLPTDDTHDYSDYVSRLQVGASPPTPDYLRNQSSLNAGLAPRYAAESIEKRASGKRTRLLPKPQMNTPNRAQNGYPPGDEGAFASSPTLQDDEDSGLQYAEARRISPSVSSVNSEELANMPEFLARYRKQVRTGSNLGQEYDDSDTDTTTVAGDETNVSVIENGLDEQRKQQEKDEKASAILSQRAEDILANAKKRLMMMEGNLRGARDLVQPLTAANLKRATSLHSPYTSSYMSRARYIPQTNPDGSPKLSSPLIGQKSSPTMNRDFHGHSRGFSETEIPERPFTLARNGRIPINVNEPSWNQRVRTSRSFDFVGSPPQPSPTAQRKESPESNLEAVPEATPDKPVVSHTRDNSALSNSSSASGTPEHLRNQIDTLKGRISSLRMRTKEDNIRRQSMRSSKASSPFNNADSNQAEMFYTQSPDYGTPTRDTNAGVGQTPDGDELPASPSLRKVLDQSQPITGSRNAFAEQIAQDQQPREATYDAPTEEQEKLAVPELGQPKVEHKRTASGSAIIAPAVSRYSHHAYNNAPAIPMPQLQQPQEESEYDQYSDVESRMDGESDSTPREYAHTEDEDTTAGDDESVYQDAESERPGSANDVAHEDRHDAFDYQHFFLHSAMGNFSNGRRGSNSSDDSTTSVETPRNTPGVDDDDFDNISGPPTPERLKQIERHLPARPMSTESLNSLASFATALESRTISRRSSAMDWPIQRTSSPHLNSTNGRQQAGSRQGVEHDRIDSGMLLQRRPNSIQDLKRLPSMRARTCGQGMISPPMSPSMLLHDPATMTVNSLMDPRSTAQLGLKDKSLLFGVVESLRRVCVSLQGQGGEHDESRQRLEEAKKALDGVVGLGIHAS